MPGSRAAGRSCRRGVRDAVSYTRQSTGGLGSCRPPRSLLSEFHRRQRSLAASLPGDGRPRQRQARVTLATLSRDFINSA